MGIETLQVDMPAELKSLIGEEADRTGVSMNEFVASVIADKFGRPDLAKIPRKKPGRPRKTTAKAG